MDQDILQADDRDDDGYLLDAGTVSAVLAAVNTGDAAALTALRRSVAIETAVGLIILALVAWFGTLAPPSAL